MKTHVGLYLFKMWKFAFLIAFLHVLYIVSHLHTSLLFESQEAWYFNKIYIIIKVIR